MLKLGSSSDYMKLELIGEGTYGRVYKAKHVTTGEIVALKKIRLESHKEGFPITAVREIKLLRQMKHNNVIALREMVSGKSKDNQYKAAIDIYLVFEYMDHDLAGLMDTLGQLTIAQTKHLLRQLLEALTYCHRHLILHRDVKTSNILINSAGVLKVGDFGLSRLLGEESNVLMTSRVVTLWYRAPELLLGSQNYGPAVDMWSVGCILAEMLLTRPLIPGKDEFDQLFKIFQLCGTPTEKSWPELHQLPLWSKMRPAQTFPSVLKQALSRYDDEAVDLISRLLVLNPAGRESANDALNHDFFFRGVNDRQLDFSDIPSSHELHTKHKRKERYRILREEQLAGKAARPSKPASAPRSSDADGQALSPPEVDPTIPGSRALSSGAAGLASSYPPPRP
eukprot:RCo011868